VSWGDLRPGPVQIVMSLFEKWDKVIEARLQRLVQSSPGPGAYAA
jgi:hypothetical protein